VNADDLGLAASVNRGIVETMERGVVRSASLIVNLGAHEDAIGRIADTRSRGVDLGIGLHFDVVAGAPLTACPSLTDARGRFLPLATLALRAVAGRIDARDVERELEAQLDRAESLLAAIGLRVTHVDSHRHAHCLPGVFDVVLRVADRRGIAHVRHPHESTRTLKASPLRLLASGALRLALTRSPPTDDVEFTGIGLMASRRVERDLLQLLDVLPAGTTELMMHPGYDSPELAAIDAYRVPRELELRALTSPSVRDRVRDLGMELTHFGAIAPPA